MPGAHQWDPYCGSAPLPGDLLGRWNLDPILLAIFALIGGWLLVSKGKAGGSNRPILVAYILALFIFVSPFCALTSALFSARVVHHVALTAMLAPLIAFGLPPERSIKVGSIAPWTALQALVFWLWHSPSVYSAALSSNAVYWLMQVSLLTSSLIFWMAIRRSSPAASVSALLASMVQMGLLGALITFAGAPLYAPHLATTVPWGLSALQDQQLGGLLMWVPAAGIYLSAALTIASRWLRAEQKLTA